MIDIERPGGFLVGPARVTVAIDVTAGTFYLPYDALRDLNHCTSPEMLEATIGTGDWKVVATYEGQVVGSAVSVKEDRDINDVWTRLFLTP